ADAEGAAVQIVVIEAVQLNADANGGGQVAQRRAAAGMEIRIGDMDAALLVNIAAAEVDAMAFRHQGDVEVNALVADIEIQFGGLAAGGREGEGQAQGRGSFHELIPTHL